MDLSKLGLDEPVKEYLNTQKQFKIDAVSQEGGNCDIFFGYHEILDKRVALKIYYGSKDSSTHNEPKILAKIKHKNILKVHYAEKIGEAYNYFMTDEILGGDLEKNLRKGNLDLKDKLSIISGILGGLCELHKPENSLVHRDIKPKNILVKRDSKTPLIADFGSVKHFNSSQSSVTGSNSTLVYKPKEVFEMNQYTVQSDIYQVGVTMFQTLGGFFPGAYVEWLDDKEKNKLSAIESQYDQWQYIESIIEKRVRQHKLLQFDTLPSYIDKGIIRIIKKAVNPKLRVRYANVGEFMNDLYKTQQNMINWIECENELIAEHPKKGRFRIFKYKSDYRTEKMGKNNKWRRCHEMSKDIKSQIKYIHSL
ncbi:protein kinase domain-containing protein [Crocinitomix algicola]|uniref:protein kinase domain-containing protein n=1 Tax=Crocinitomix algicola TaxID=1740263 RepID=UPI000871CD75|nr:protein kinase [Crocinitomix algicola]